MYLKKIITTIVLLLLIAAPILADKDNDNDSDATDEEMYDEIDNYDFLYTGEEYDYGYSFTQLCDVMDEAFSHIGDRYRAGHAGPNAFDCSGFTSYVFAHEGISLKRSSREQYNQGQPVDRRNLKVGDLVFFKSPGSRGSIGHVGIVVDVDSDTGSFDFIHASSNKGVTVSSSNEAYYLHRYVGARRVM